MKPSINSIVEIFNTNTSTCPRSCCRRTPVSSLWIRVNASLWITIGVADVFETRKRFRLDKYTDLEVYEAKNRDASYNAMMSKSASVIYLKLRRLIPGRPPSVWGHSQNPGSTRSSIIECTDCKINRRISTIMRKLTRPFYI